MRFWTAYLRADAEPVLVREGFAWGALFFGPLWLALHRAWVPAAIVLAAVVLVAVAGADPAATVLGIGLAIFLGLTGHDLVRWSLEQRGYLLVHVLAARSQTEALGRLLAQRPELGGRFLPAASLR